MRSRANQPFPDAGGGRPGGLDEGAFDLGTGGRPAGVHHPGRRMAALAGELPDAPVVAVELGAEGRQLTHPGRALADEHLHRGPVAQAGPGPEGVGGVQGDRVDEVRAVRCGLHVGLACDGAPPPPRPGPTGWPSRPGRPSTAPRSAGRAPPRRARAAADRPATPLPTTSRSSGSTAAAGRSTQAAGTAGVVRGQGDAAAAGVGTATPSLASRRGRFHWSTCTTTGA